MSGGSVLNEGWRGVRGVFFGVFGGDVAGVSAGVVAAGAGATTTSSSFCISAFSAPDWALAPGASWALLPAMTSLEPCCRSWEHCAVLLAPAWGPRGEERQPRAWMAPGLPRDNWSDCPQLIAECVVQPSCRFSFHL